MTLYKVKAQQRVRILNISGGIGVRRLLHQLGIFEGGSVLVKRRSHFGGPILIEHNQSEIALGRGMAEQVMVEFEISSGD
jgi:Fe2+ transport system protein FeoA